jgi:hypothetical protein
MLITSKKQSPEKSWLFIVLDYMTSIKGILGESRDLWRIT